MAASISDGAHGGNAHFFFLAPLAKTPTYSGVANLDLLAEVRVCKLDGADGACSAEVATFDRLSGTGSETVRWTRLTSTTSPLQADQARG